MANFSGCESTYVSLDAGLRDSALSQGKPGPTFTLLVLLASWYPGRAQAHDPEGAVAHCGQGPHLDS